MKKIIFGIFAFLLSAQAFSQAFTFSGSITGAPDAKMRFSYLTNEDRSFHVDSCSLRDGSFTFKGVVNGSIMAFISVYKGAYKPTGTEDFNNASFFITPGNIIGTANYGHVKDIKITGSKVEDEYEKFQSLFTELHKQSDPIEAHFNKVNAEYSAAKKQKRGDKTLDSLDKIREAIRNQMEPYSMQGQHISRQYILKHPDSYVTAYLFNIYQRTWSADSVKLIYSQFSTGVKSNVYSKMVLKSIEDMDKNSANKPAANFTTVDYNGKNLSLANFKGRYVLLDFWASWCVPCREGTPHLMALYKKYNNAGFDIIGVADDDNAVADWKKAIKKDKTEAWYHVLRGLKSMPDGSHDISKSIADQFAVSVYPTKILVDKNGIIVGRYVGTEEEASLDKKLAEIFK